MTRAKYKIYAYLLIFAMFIHHMCLVCVCASSECLFGYTVCGFVGGFDMVVAMLYVVAAATTSTIQVKSWSPNRFRRLDTTTNISIQHPKSSRAPKPIASTPTPLLPPATHTHKHIIFICQIILAEVRSYREYMATTMHISIYRRLASTKHDNEIVGHQCTLDMMCIYYIIYGDDVHIHTFAYLIDERRRCDEWSVVGVSCRYRYRRGRGRVQSAHTYIEYTHLI